MNSLKRIFTSAIVMIALAIPLYASDLCCPAAGSLAFHSTLAGTQFGGVGSPVGFGLGNMTFDPVRNRARVRMRAWGIGEEISSAGLFLRSSSGTMSQVLQLTDTTDVFDDRGELDRWITVTPELMSDILANPSNYWFTVATPQYATGAIAGALAPSFTFGGAFSGSAIVGGTGASDGGGALSVQIVPTPNGTGHILSYSFVPMGIGNQITGLELREGAAGANGALFINLSGAATLTDGRLAGSVPLTAEQAHLLMTAPWNYHIVANTADFPAGAVRAQFSAVRHELFFPIVAATHGASQTVWESDLRLFNPSFDSTATVLIEFFSAGQANGFAGVAVPTRSVVLTIAPRGVEVIDNVMSTLFDLETGSGALRISSDERIIATGQLFDDRRNASAGTVGQTIYAMTLCDAHARGIITGVAGERAGISAGFRHRSNIGLFNPTGFPVRVRLELTNRTGELIATRALTLNPYEQVQYPLMGSLGLFANSTADLTAGSVSFEAEAPIFVYASVVDNRSADPNLILAVGDNSVHPLQ
jgi:hypothetical protein